MDGNNNFAPDSRQFVAIWPPPFRLPALILYAESGRCYPSCVTPKEARSLVMVSKSTNCQS